MNKHDQNGAINGLVIPLVIISLLLVGSGGFAAWAYAGRQDYKNNTDTKIAAAVTIARQDESTNKDKLFAEVEKQPLRSYIGPQAYGSLIVKYPKTWSAYVDDTGNGNAQVDGFFYPGTVPSITNQNSSFALRLQVLPQSYTTVVTSFRDLEQAKKVSISPYALAKVPKIIGIRVEGEIKPTKTGSLVILPLRDKTILISSESSEFSADFNANILPNLSFSP